MAKSNNSERKLSNELEKPTRKTTRGAKTIKLQATKKIFVLDTSVVLFDHKSIKEFAEHDIVIPITVLEEVDHFKKGNEDINFSAREFIRLIDKIAGENNLHDWIPLNGPTKGLFKIDMNIKGIDEERDADVIFNEFKNDHKILNCALRLTEEYSKRKVVLVTKDVNLRLKAKAMNIIAEDYKTVQIKDLDTLYKGHSVEENIPSEKIDELYEKKYLPWKKIIKNEPVANHFYLLKHTDSKTCLSYYNPEKSSFEVFEKPSAYGIKPKNYEQAFALRALLDPNISLVTIQGVAGTGKTLLALAAALEMRRHYRQIYLARPIVPLSNRDIGYLPGDIKSKINPYMEPLYDNLKFIQNQYKETEKEHKAVNEMLENEKLMVTPLAYIRGRSLSNIYFIIDEAQNLTPHEVKTIITRAGEGTKIVFTGDIYQIDSPYLDAHSNGLSVLIDKVKGSSLYAHVSLQRGERSTLANLANELL